MQEIYLTGMAIPLTFIMMNITGGFLRSDYNHISNSVSTLIFPGAPNKRLLIIIQIIYAFLHVIFGFGVLWFIKGLLNNHCIGQTGAWLIIALGNTTIATVIFPPDAEGMPKTKSGLLHERQVFSGLILFSILSTLFIGLWSRQKDIFPGFDIQADYIK